MKHKEVAIQLKDRQILNPEDDLYGQALYDYYKGVHVGDLCINTSYGDVEEMPPEVFFRDFDDFPVLEAIALEHCRGKVLDVGAGTGCHSLILQDKGLDVKPIDISPYCVKIMHARGIEQVDQTDFFSIRHQKFNTILLLMNGLGLVGKIKNMPNFLSHCKKLLEPGGQILLDSSDVNYLTEEYKIKSTGQYIGEISYQYVYKNNKGPWFDWLYLEKARLQEISEKEGWRVEFLFEDVNNQYLASITKE